ncbi:hypothetical protein, partial [Kosmotoga arenicorallina]|uniref:hypothetical protein n=1 Tax=Kosmotoga arenicorallina TaxID=688066 RepID=UPI000B2E944B
SLKKVFFPGGNGSIFYGPGGSILFDHIHLNISILDLMTDDITVKSEEAIKKECCEMVFFNS